MALHDQQDSSLLRLPAGIRNHIWGYVLTLQRPIEVHRALTLASNSPPCDLCFKIPDDADMETWVEFSGLLDLSQVCRDLRAETRVLAFSANIFAIQVENIKSFAKLLSEHARPAIKALAVRTMHHHHENQHVRERWFQRLDKILEALVMFNSLKKIFLQNYGTLGMSVEEWEEAILSNAGFSAEVEIVEERIVKKEKAAGVEKELAAKYW
jgi:hypothetical protein